jgi:hypothetical protein
MENLLIFIIATIGLTNILVHGKVLDEIKVCKRSVREWLQYFNFTKELLSCYECTGWWSGLLLGLVFVFGIGQNPFYLIMYPFAGSVVSAFYSELIFMVRSKTDFVVDDQEENAKTEDN